MDGSLVHQMFWMLKGVGIRVLEDSLAQEMGTPPFTIPL